MKVLFVSSGRKGDVGEVVKNQGDSLKKIGLEVDYFTIKPGIKGYFLSICKIRNVFKNGKYDLIHAHYSFSAFAASLAGNFPLIVSLMGSDAYMSGFWRAMAWIFYCLRWDATIVKTQKMKEILKMKKAYVIPNGVDTERFKPIDKKIALEKIGYKKNKKLIIFVADPARHEKNYALALESVKLLNRNDVELLTVYNISNEKMPYFMNVADVLLLTSKWEGSPNIIKEAMACNCPIVATDVGDLRWVIGDTAGCYVTTFYPKDIADKIKEAIEFNKRTNGRERLIKLGLDSDSVSERINSIYNNIVKIRKK